MLGYDPLGFANLGALFLLALLGPSFLAGAEPLNVTNLQTTPYAVILGIIGAAGIGSLLQLTGRAIWNFVWPMNPGDGWRWFRARYFEHTKRSYNRDTFRTRIAESDALAEYWNLAGLAPDGETPWHHGEKVVIAAEYLFYKEAPAELRDWVRRRQYRFSDGLSAATAIVLGLLLGALFPGQNRAVELGVAVPLAVVAVATLVFANESRRDAQHMETFWYRARGLENSREVPATQTAFAPATELVVRPKLVSHRALTLGGQGAVVAIQTPGQSGQATFEASAGAKVNLNVSAVTINASDVSILNPDGTPLVQPTPVGTSGLLFPNLTLSQTGTYTVTIDPRVVYTGSMTLALSSVPPDATASLTRRGERVILKIGTPGQKGQATFEGTAGEKYSLVVSNADVLASDVSIRNPDGTFLVQQKRVVGNDCFLDFLMVRQPGTYTVDVDPLSARTGSITLSLWSLPPDAALLTPGGTGVKLEFGVPGGKGKATFQGKARQRYVLNLKLDKIARTAISIRNPDGTLLIDRKPVAKSNVVFDVTTPDQTGPYTVIVGAYTGSVTLTL